MLADDGTLWVNIGDSYSGSWGGQGVTPKTAGYQSSAVAAGAHGSNGASRTGAIKPGAPPAKNLLGIPWRLAFALQDDGWILRNDIIWSKPNGMPESVRDRLSNKHEHVFMLSKSRRYWFDLDPIREVPVTTRAEALTWARDSKEADVPGQSMRQHRAGRAGATPPGSMPQTNFGPTGKQHTASHDNGRNPGDVWAIPTTPFPGAHFAVMSPALAERCVLAGCKPGGTVLDPFSGVGTTGMVATRHGRRYIGIDNNADTLALSLSTRLAQSALIEGAS